MKFIPSLCTLYSRWHIKILVLRLSLPDLWSSSPIELQSPRKCILMSRITFFLGCFLNSWGINEFTIPRKMSLKSQRCTAHLGCYCFIFAIYLWISSVSFQFSGLFLLLSSSHRPPRFSLWCCIVPLPNHSFQNSFQIHCVSKPQIKEKLFLLLENAVLIIELNSALLKVF